MRSTGIVSLIAYEAAQDAARVAANPFSIPRAPPFRVEALPDPWTSEIRSSGIRQWLHRSVHFDTLFDMAQFGADLAYAGSVHQWPRGSYPNAVPLQFQEEISKQIQTEMANGWLLRVPAQSTFLKDVANAPILAADEITKVRRITDFSNRRQSLMLGVNALVQKDQLGSAPMHRPNDLARAVHALKAQFPGERTLLLVRDLSKAFRRISVRLGQVPSLVTQWQGARYWDLRLPFGHAASAHYCCKLSTAIAEAIDLHFMSKVRCLAYVDDFIIIAPESLAQPAEELFARIVADIGLTLSESKAVASGGWDTCAEWIGFEHDTVNMTHSLPARKLGTYMAAAAQCALSISNKQSVSQKQLQSLVGQLNHVATIFTAGRAFMRNLLSACKATIPASAPARLNASQVADLQWWLHALPRLPQAAAMRRRPGSGDPLIASDASLYGVGAVLDPTGDEASLHTVSSVCQTMSGGVQGPCVSGDMTLLEMWAVLAALRLWAHALKGATLRVHVDNVSVQYALKKGRSFSPRVNNVLQRVMLLCLEHDICLHPLRVQTEHNIVADTLSRNPHDVEVALEAHQVHRVPTIEPRQYGDVHERCSHEPLLA